MIENAQQMRLCLFVPSFFPEIGGLEVAADRFALSLHSLGHKVVVFAQRPRKKLSPIQRLYPIIHYKRPRSTTWFPFSAGLALERLHREFDFDLICAYQAYLPGYIAVRFGRKHSIPTIISCRGGDISETGRYLKRSISRNRIIWTLKHADAVTALSKHLAQQVSILTNNSVTACVIHNAIEMMDGNPLADTTPNVFAHLENKPFILTLGRLHRVKGLDLLLDAIKLLKDQNKTVPTLAIAGDGPEKSRLLKQVDKNNLTNFVTFAGQVSGSEKTWVLTNCQFLVQPSRSEGLPNSVLEAMSHGKPVLTTAVGGLSEIVTNGKNGLLVEPNNVVSLAKGLGEMLTLDLASYSENAKKVALEHSWDNITKRHIRLYESLIQKSPSKTYRTALK